MLFKPEDEQLIFKMYEVDRLNTYEISKYFNISPGSIQRLLRKTGKIRTNSDSHLKINVDNNVKNKIINLYKNGISCKDIGKQLDLSESYIFRFLKYNKLSRTRSESASLKIGIKNGFYGKNHKIETKNKISNARKEYYKLHPEEKAKYLPHNVSGKNAPFYGHKHSDETKKLMSKNSARRGHTPNHSQRIYPHITPFQGIVKMHRWEHFYAQYLDSISEPYFYEPNALEMNINGKNTTYTPDFSLPKKLEFIEIKGYWRDDAKLKSDKFKEEIENFEGIFNYNVLFGEDLQKLGIDLKKHIIPFNIKKCKSLFDF